jgi:hypothetical protein
MVYASGIGHAMKYLYSILRLFICPHKWNRINTISVMSDDYDLPVGFEHVCQCIRCGKIKKFRV